MKSITVKHENHISVYISGMVSQINEDGEWEEVAQTDEEMEQHCYRSLIDSVKKEEFEKYMISLLSNYLSNRQMEGWTNIHIRLDYSNHSRVCEMNIANDKNLQFVPMDIDINLSENKKNNEAK